MEDHENALTAIARLVLRDRPLRSLAMTQSRPFSEPSADATPENVRYLSFSMRPAPDVDYPAIASVQAHWEVLREGRSAPARSEIDPRPIAASLDVLFIAELVAPGVARLRLCGQQFTEILGMEPRGMPLSVFFAQDARDGLSAAVAQVSQGVRATLPVRAEKGIGRPALDGMLALMPLADQDGRITRVLGVLETHGQIGRSPRRFKLSAPLPTRGDAPAPRTVETPTLTVIRGGQP